VLLTHVVRKNFGANNMPAVFSLWFISAERRQRKTRSL